MGKKSIQRERLSKETVGLAGEYAVASELCRRGHYAQLTLGHHKKTDLLVETKSGASGALFRRVSVKSKTRSQWPKVTGIWDQGDLIIFVDFDGKRDGERPDFYILDLEAWKKVVKNRQSKNRVSKIDKATNTLYWEAAPGQKNGWRGCIIRLVDVAAYKERWETVA